MKSNIKNAYQKTIPELEDSLHDAFKAYKKAQTEAVSWRDGFMIALATSRAESKGTDKDAELKQLRSIEMQKTTARNIKRMQGKLQCNATIKIYVSDENGR